MAVKTDLKFFLLTTFASSKAFDIRLSENGIFAEKKLLKIFPIIYMPRPGEAIAAM